MRLSEESEGSHRIRVGALLLDPMITGMLDLNVRGRVMVLAHEHEQGLGTLDTADILGESVPDPGEVAVPDTSFLIVENLQ